MVKVTNPLMSGDARGKFGNKMIFTRGGQARRYFKPRNPNTPAQRAVREAFKEFSVPGLTQEQADLLYAAILHLHDDRYSLLAHGHDHGALAGLADDDHEQYFNQTRGDARYIRKVFQVFYPNGGNGTVAAGATNYLNPWINGIIASTGRSMLLSKPCVVRDLYFSTNGAQPGTGSFVITIADGAGNSTGVTATVPAGGAAQLVSDVSHTYTITQAMINAGIALTVAMKNNASSASATVGGCSFTLEY